MQYATDNVTLRYDYTGADGDGWNEPRTSERVDIYSVTAGGVEIIDLINPKILTYWEEEILESLGDDEDPPERNREWESNYER